MCPLPNSTVPPFPFPLRSDSYKLTHWRQYPPGTTEVYSYLESRGGRFPATTFFGLQPYLRSYLAGPVVTAADVELADRLAAQHFGRHGIFNKSGWMHIVERHGGRLPVEIRAVAEGTVVPNHNVLMTIRNTDPACCWLTNFLETLLLKVWYPVTVATLSGAILAVIKRALERSGEDTSGANMVLHDFGYRGASSEETAALGGAAHLVHFRTSDTLIANILLREHYSSPENRHHDWMPATSVVATEHSTMTAWGREHELDAYRNVLNEYPAGIVSIVVDSFDVYRAAREMFGGALREQVLARDGLLVLRPDSGDPVEVLLRLLPILAERFGSTSNSSGYKNLHPKVRLLWGDGVGLESIERILDAMLAERWSAANLIFGMGGALLQRVHRDTQKFAFKCSSAIVDDELRDVFKEPITDPGKDSKRGKLALLRTAHGLETVHCPGNCDLEGDLLETVFRNGEVLRHQTLEDIRQRALVV
jgi:nicotinamide phosphoribosyltransferase